MPFNERARLITNEIVGPRLYLMRLEAPNIAASIAPGQFVHMRVPQMEERILRRPFSVYSADASEGTIDILYQTVGEGTAHMAKLDAGHLLPEDVFELIGPQGNTWLETRDDAFTPEFHALLVGGGVGAAPLYMLAEKLKAAGSVFDVVLGAQTKDAHVCRMRYGTLMGREPFCATDDGSYGRPGFCTVLVEERLAQGCAIDGKPYDCVAVCGPWPLMRIVSGMAEKADVACEVSTEKRMACGVGACLSCVVDTTEGKKRSCVDGPIFDGRKVVW